MVSTTSLSAPTDSGALSTTSLYRSQGYVTVSNLLSDDACRRLRNYIQLDLQNAVASSEEQGGNGNSAHVGPASGSGRDDPPKSKPTAGSAAARLCNIRKRKNRWDLKLTPSPILSTTMAEILNSDMSATETQTSPEVVGFDNDTESYAQKEMGGNFLETVLAPLLGCQDAVEDVVLVELGSLISDPGAPAQDWHPDSTFDDGGDRNISYHGDDDKTSNQNSGLVCCFLALQDTPPTMGPTEVIPYTHTREFHESTWGSFPPKGVMPAYVAPKSAEAGYRVAGEACLMNCKLYHRGGANTHGLSDLSTSCRCDERTRSASQVVNGGDNTNDEDFDGRRFVFYFTVRSRAAPPPGGNFFSIVDELDGVQLIDFVQ